MMTMPCTRVLQNQDRQSNYQYHEENQTSYSTTHAIKFWIFLFIFIYEAITIRTMTKQK